MLLNLSKQLPLTAEKQKFHLASFKSDIRQFCSQSMGSVEGARMETQMVLDGHIYQSLTNKGTKKENSIKRTSLQLARHFALRSALSVFTVGTHTRTETREEFSTPVGVLSVYCVRRLASRSGGRN